MSFKVIIAQHVFNSPAITDNGRDSISGEGGYVCGSDVEDVVGAAATEMRRMRI